MPSLLDALQRITPWYLDPDQDIPKNFPIGLANTELIDLLNDLPFQLPEEVCELYQWCNGSRNPQNDGQILDRSDTFQFNVDYMAKASIIPLKEAINLWFEENDEEVITEYWYRFPILSHENGLIVIEGRDEMEESSPVWDFDWLKDADKEPTFPDLTHMMMGVAESLEAEQQFTDDQGCLDETGYWKAYDLIWPQYRS